MKCPACGAEMSHVPADVEGDFDVPDGTQAMPPIWLCDECGQQEEDLEGNR